MLKRIKSAGIFTPYPPIIGGGERYIYTIAETLLLKNISVTILSPFDINLDLISNQFNLKLSKLIIQKVGPEYLFLPVIYNHFDLFFTLSNHIVPPVFGQGTDNNLIIQFPFPFPNHKFGDLLQRKIAKYKLNSYNRILCYSKFSKKWIKLRLTEYTKKNIPISILNPAVDNNRFTNIDINNKKNYILSVGRFFYGDHNKKHLDLINVFKKISNYKISKKWELHLVGYLHNDSESKKYFDKIKIESINYPIFLHPNISSDKLNELYSKSKIIWHGTGFDNCDDINPEKSEHFGIVVIEGMAAGAVPLVANTGALSEIVTDNLNGLIWKNLFDLENLTIKLINDDNLLKLLSKNARNKIKQFDVQFFRDNIYDLYHII
jgi:glycosyltransferase involved in cell wall biosynthesis